MPTRPSVCIQTIHTIACRNMATLTIGERVGPASALGWIADSLLLDQPVGKADILPSANLGPEADGPLIGDKKAKRTFTPCKSKPAILLEADLHKVCDLTETRRGPRSQGMVPHAPSLFQNAARRPQLRSRDAFALARDGGRANRQSLINLRRRDGHARWLGPLVTSLLDLKSCPVPIFPRLA